jgi:hypothetical protein
MHEIQNGMCLFLQREKRAKQAIFNGILSHLFQIKCFLDRINQENLEYTHNIALYEKFNDPKMSKQCKDLHQSSLDHSNNWILSLSTEESVDYLLESLCKKAKLEDKIPLIKTIFKKHVELLPKIDSALLKNELSPFML